MKAPAAWLAMTALATAGVAEIASNATPPAGAVMLVKPGVNYRIDEASASSAPWVNENGWRILRKPGAAFFYDAPGKSSAVAAAEAFEFGARAAIHTDAAGLAPLQEMIAFLKTLPDGGMKTMANIGLVDDGTPRAGEVMNLLVRRNLLFEPVSAPAGRYDLTVNLGSKTYPAAEAANPDLMAHRIRQDLGDDKRLVRIYGSEVVIARLEGGAGGARVHLLNYDGARRRVEGLRVRVLGNYPKGRVWASGIPGAKLLDYSARPEATEFTLPELEIYAMVELER